MRYTTARDALSRTADADSRPTAAERPGGRATTPRRLRNAGVLAVLAFGLLFSGGVLHPAPAHADPVDEVESDIEKQYHDLEAVIEDYNAINEEFEDTKAKIEDLEAELKPYEERLDALYEKVGAIAGSAYMGGDLSGLTALLTTGTPDTLADRITMLDQATADDSEAIDELNAAKAELDDRKAGLDGLYATQSEQESELAETKEKIESDIERLQDDRDEAYRTSRGLSDDDFIPPYVPGDRGKVVRFALKQVGDAYDWAAAGPDAWDCSGLMLGAWSQVGVDLPHNAAMEWNRMTHISRNELKPGDLVFYNGLDHVGMYIGEDHVVHASDYGIGVIISTVDGAASSYYGAARVPGW